MRKWDEYYPVVILCILLGCLSFIVVASVVLLGDYDPEHEKLYMIGICAVTWLAAAIGWYDMVKAVAARRETRELIQKAIAGGLDGVNP